MRRIAHRGALMGAVGLALVAVLGPSPTSARSDPTVWLCKPGDRPDPCTPRLGTTLLSPTGAVLGTTSPKRAKHPRDDCFYVYPTVSEQPTRNANLQIDPEERSIARTQAGRYSQQCRIFAPIYRQQTIAALSGPDPETPAERRIAYSGVVTAWRKYLRTYNGGRGFVLIGHSQGSEVLAQLIAEQIDPHPALRRRMLSALLMGGNIKVRKGKRIGADFKHIPGCHSRTQLGCIVAFSTFNAPVPDGSLYGRPGGPFGGGDPSRVDILCTNPAAPGGGSKPLDSIFPKGAFAAFVGLPMPLVSTPWIEYRGAYEGHCSAADNAHVLQVSSLGGAPVLNAFPDPTWGLHLLDANIALGNLVDLLRDEIRVYGKR